jgi:hypothetical protein
MNFNSGLAFVVAWIRHTGCRCLLVMVLLCLVLRENYPFSNFPMYSSSGRHAYYLYLTDEDGRALKTRQFGLSNSTLKKIFDGYRQKELAHFADAGRACVLLAEEAAGQSLLLYLDGLSAARPQVRKLLVGLQVEHVLVRQDAHDLVFETRTIARHP